MHRLIPLPMLRLLPSFLAKKVNTNQGYVYFPSNSSCLASHHPFIQTIPIPKTLDDFDSREFAADNHVYSSFAYLIGAIRGVSMALSCGLSKIENVFAPQVLEMVDTVIEGWRLLLPKAKRQLVSRHGEFDELLFQAHMALHA
jgi:hypothetical protein